MSPSPAGNPPDAGDPACQTIIAEALSMALLARVRTLRVLLETDAGGSASAAEAMRLHDRLEAIEAELEARRRAAEGETIDIVYLD